ncbi:RecQ family ATP-dependent DNA helicase [Neptunitalea lumnitzerae]|uniref:ATP-dependent DNA helicase RecQ n=1 Tax=Neptunitalea lumnitzerae TaxID=2965509 RepID=A0ABQ5MIQ6_9FLAO|nr:ATP-dependent DNA helicase RecQ [Neptunitalea sp. Y10]GLB49290.1 ATP-dependent DNA helicase RecQ2 [Neptunitalea sp. Y10]
MQTPAAVLNKYWGFDSFRDLQEDIINSVLENKDTVALLPTGGGKTMCFQVPALVKNGICIVVSPLVALMKEQVQKLQEKNIKAIALTGGISLPDLDATLDNAIYGNYKFLYLSPERLQQELVLERIKQMDVSMIAIDEAHCISQWGNNFRPAYRNCVVLKELFPKCPMIALTASATPKVLKDIQENLHIEKANVFQSSFARPNVAYMTFTEENSTFKLIQILKKNKGSSIIYVRNRKATKEISALIEQEGIKATYFHGGLTTNEKTDRLNDWLSNRIQVMVATNAFGMGIDKPDVRTVIHLSYPDSIESYFQEAGRAGRDGKKSFAILFRNKVEEKKAIQQYIEVLPDTKTIKFIYKKLYNYFQISYGEGENTNHTFNFNDFCNTYQLPAASTYLALQLLDRFSIIALTDNFREKHTILIHVSRGTYEHYLAKHPSYNMWLDVILRTYGGVFNYETAINPVLIATKTRTAEKDIIAMLEQLAKDEIITYEAVKTDAEITFLVPREDDQTINIIAKDIKEQQEHIKKQLLDTIAFINNDTICKSIQLLSYFGEENATNCGICSVCIADKLALRENNYPTIKNAILTLLTNNAASSQVIYSSLPYHENHILEALKKMLEEGNISINHKNEFYKN